MLVVPVSRQHALGRKFGLAEVALVYTVRVVLQIGVFDVEVVPNGE